MTAIGWGVRQFTRVLLRDDCANLARALQKTFTSGRLKQQAAVILQNIATEQSVCQFCGGGPNDVLVLVESPFNPKVMICDCCAARAASYAKDARGARPGITKAVSPRIPDDRENPGGEPPTQ